MAFAILSGGLDLSVGALLAVGVVVAASPVGLGAGAALPRRGSAATGLLGLVNGVVVAKGRIQPFIATLVMALAARGALLAWTGEQSVRVPPGRCPSSPGWAAAGWAPSPCRPSCSWWPTPWAGRCWHTPASVCGVHAVGDNDEAGRLMGLNVERVAAWRSTASACALAGLAGAAGGAGWGGVIAGRSPEWSGCWLPARTRHRSTGSRRSTTSRSPSTLF